MELKIAAMVLKELGHTTRHSGLDPESSSFITDIRLTGSPGKAGENTVLPRLL